MVEYDQAAGEEELADEGRAARVGRDDRGAERRRVVDAPVRRARLAVDDASGAEACAGLRSRDGAREPAAPEAFGGDGFEQRREPLRLGQRAPFSLEVQVHHRAWEREVLDGEPARLEPDRAPRRSLLPVAPVDRDAPPTNSRSGL